MEINGEFHCGHITYRADIDSGKVGICHFIGSHSARKVGHRFMQLSSVAGLRSTVFGWRRFGLENQADTGMAKELPLNRPTA